MEAKYSDLDGSEARWLKALAQERRRFGYRRLHVLLRREGHAVNKKRVQRLYREERLMVRQRGGRKRAMGTRRPIETPAVANQRWGLDFVADQFTDGRRFRILEVYDDAPASVWRGKPATIVSDNGTELTSNAILEWADQHKVGWTLHRSRQAPAEQLQRARAARRTAERDPVQLSLADARAELEAWRRDFNEGRPHSSLAYLTPAAYARALCGGRPTRCEPRPLRAPAPCPRRS